MFGLKLGQLGLTGGNRWSESALWPAGIATPGMWIDPAYTAASFQTSTGSTPLSAIGTVADSANPVGLMLDRRGGATVLADPGNHLLQATAAARPFASGRSNIVTKSGNIMDAAWTVLGGTKTAAPSNPAGYTNAALFTQDGVTVATSSFIRQTGTQVFTHIRILAKAGPRPGNVSFRQSGLLANEILVDLVTGAIVAAGANWQSTFIEPADNGWFWFGGKLSALSPAQDFRLSPSAINIDFQLAAVHMGNSYTYQPVDTASSYTATGFPVYNKLDGTDDAQATAAFAAGTFTAGMTALIAVRRDSAASAVCGLYNAVAGSHFGMAISGDAGVCFSGCGTPTVHVDNTQLTGGTGVTAGTLHTALTAGPWHILEFRDLDLSAWTAIGRGLYTGYKLNGGLGKTFVFPNASTANLNAARAAMASYYGVTLA